MHETYVSVFPVRIHTLSLDHTPAFSYQTMADLRLEQRCRPFQHIRDTVVNNPRSWVTAITTYEWQGGEPWRW